MKPLIRPALTSMTAFADLLYPPVCPICLNRLDNDDAVVCFRCRAHLVPQFEWQCPRCAASGFGTGPLPERPCRLCPPSQAAYSGVLNVTGYDDKVATCIHGFKYQARLELGRWMARMMVERLEPSLARLGGRVRVITPVPLHWIRRRILRGFNQSLLLARPLARVGQSTLDPHLLRRVRHTRRQARVPRERRARNVRNAFQVRHPERVRDQGVLLVDDVVTSGETVGECARVLREAGAREVWVACFARAGLGLPDEFQL